MRFSMAVAVLGLVASTAVAAPTRDDQLKPVSVQFTEAGRAALAKGDASAAIDSFEAALASDPRNVGAFTGIAQSYEKLGLPGKAVKYYREALALNPSDIAALEGQGNAYIARGATARAQVNLARIKALCKAECAAAERLQTALSEPPKATGTPVAANDTPKAARN